MKNIATGLLIVVLATVFAPFFLLYMIGSGDRMNPKTLLPCLIGHALLWALAARMVGWL